MQVRITYML